VVGLGAIVWSCVVYNSNTPFPGAAALVPTLGTVLIIAAGTGAWTAADTTGVQPPINSGSATSDEAGHHGIGQILGLQPMRWIGRLSYALYLWHWPLLILVEGRTGPLAWPWQLLVVTGSVVPAMLTMFLVERPLRFSAVVRSSASCGLALGVTATCIALLAALLIGSHVLREVGGQGNSTRAAATLNAQITDASLAADPLGTTTAGGGPVRPDLLQAATDVPDFPSGCTVSSTATTSPPCIVSDGPTIGKVVLLGDGSAGQWFPTVQAVAQDHDWAVEILTKDKCPLTAIGGPTPPGVAGLSCTTWLRHTITRLRSSVEPKLVFLASASTQAGASTFGRVTATLDRLGAPLVYLRAAPTARADILDCLSTSLSHWAACAEPRSTALPPDPLTNAISAGRLPGLHLADLATALCPGSGAVCPAVGKGVLIYRSADALTAIAAADLGPTLEAELEADGLVTLHVGPTGPPRAAGPTTPSPLQAPNDWPTNTSRCLIGVKPTSTSPCFYGDLKSKTTVVLMGDSHALEWIPTFSIIASERGWRLEVYAKESCPAPLLYTYAPATTQPYTACTAWRSNTLAAIARGPKPRMIILGTLNRYTRDRAVLINGWRNTLDKLEAIHAPIIYLRDTPFSQSDVPSCLSASLGDWAHCSFSEQSGVWPDPVAQKLEAGWFPDVRVINIDALLCPAGTCQAVIDGIDLYIDQSHMTAVFSALLAPVMTNELDAAEAGLAHRPAVTAGASGP